MIGNPQQAGAILQAAADAIATSVGALYAAGARRFLVWNVPNVGLTPTVRFLDAQQPGTAATATFATGLFNTYVGLALSPLSALPGISLVPFDAASLMTSIVIDPAPFGLTNVTDACVTPGVAPFTCQAAGQYLFWDGIHPTRAAHAIFAEVVALLLGL